MKRLMLGSVAAALLSGATLAAEINWDADASGEVFWRSRYLLPA